MPLIKITGKNVCIRRKEQIRKAVKVNTQLHMQSQGSVKIIWSENRIFCSTIFCWWSEYWLHHDFGHSETSANPFLVGLRLGLHTLSWLRIEFWCLIKESPKEPHHGNTLRNTICFKFWCQCATILCSRLVLGSVRRTKHASSVTPLGVESTQRNTARPTAHTSILLTLWNVRIWIS